jgi:hypothetical protein
MHGTAVNPDTGGIAEYKELSTCSDSNLWQASNADEIGHMFQGLGPDSYMPTGTNTLFFINRKNIPKHKNQPTSVLSVLTDQKRPTQSESDGRLATARSNLLATSLPKPPTSRLPNAFSTAL